MNEYLSGLILGVVQGLTEFLPVSSSGHLALLEYAGVGAPDLATNLFLHVATLLAVLVAYRKRILYLLRHPKDPRVAFVLLASVPTALLAAAIRYLVPQTGAYLPLCFFITSFLLLLPQTLRPKPAPLEEKMVPKALFVGVMQGLACFNGVSRSGSTVSALTLCGAEEEESAFLSFLLSVPVILGSATVELATNRGFHVGGGMILGGVAAFFVGLFAIRSFVTLLKKRRLALFSVYTAAMGIVSFFVIFSA